MEKAKTISRRALGRGLATLIPTIGAEDSGGDNEIHMVESDVIFPNPFQPRRDFNEEETRGLAESIKNQGLLQPIILRRCPQGYQIISGERRYRALMLLEWDRIPCVIRTKASDREMLEIALVENVQREDLNEIEKAEAYQRLLDECHLSHEDLAKRVGKTRSSITNTTRLLKLSREIQEMVRAGALTMGHARALLAVEDETRRTALAHRIISANLSVRDVENIIRKGKAGVVKRKAAYANTPLSPDLADIVDRLKYRFGTKVQVVSSDEKKGRIQIPFRGRDDLNRILDILLPRA